MTMADLTAVPLGRVATLPVTTNQKPAAPAAPRPAVARDEVKLASKPPVAQDAPPKRSLGQTIKATAGKALGLVLYLPALATIKAGRALQALGAPFLAGPLLF